MYVTDLREKQSDNYLIEINSNNSKLRKNSNFKNKNGEFLNNKEIINNKTENKKEINIYNGQKRVLDTNKMKYSPYLKEDNINEPKNTSKISTSQKKYDEYSKNRFNDNFQNYNMNLTRRNKNNKYTQNYRSSDRNKIYSEESIGTNMEDFSSSYELKKLEGKE